MEAARKARCYDFMMALPNGFDTVIGEGGESLSGGERQRISIARCILKDAPIVILDEATASVDADNESYIQQAITGAGQDPAGYRPPAEHHPECRSDPGDRGRGDRPAGHPPVADGGGWSLPELRHGATAEPGVEPPGRIEKAYFQQDAVSKTQRPFYIRA